MNDRDRYPSLLLSDVLWDFEGRDTYSSQAEFLNAVEQYRVELEDDDPDSFEGREWDAAAIVLTSPIVALRFYADPAEGPDGFREEILTSGDARGFTAGELLFKIHNATVALLATAGHHWFEGLTFNNVRGDIPTYTLIGGS